MVIFSRFYFCFGTIGDFLSYKKKGDFFDIISSKWNIVDLFFSFLLSKKENLIF
jgi:hypothetical protein